MSADQLISYLKLVPHPEGGFYKETYRSEGLIESACLPATFNGDRNYQTAIYFLLRNNDFSAFHRIKSDECWHHYEGGTLLIHVINQSGAYTCIHLGKNIGAGEVYQAVVPAGAWFASEPAPDAAFVLVGCTVAPGFDFADFEMANATSLTNDFPQHQQLVQRLCR